MKKLGKLTVVATPIGNLEDVSPRVIKALAGAENIACEDTRRAGQLLMLLGVSHKPKLMSYHKDNEKSSADGLAALLKRGENVCLISDSGLPGISDPGASVVALARGLGAAVEVIPGPCAAAIAVAGSGFEGAFTFVGFLPRKGKERKAWIERFARAEETVVMYESPHRVAETVAELLEKWGNRPAWLARELTKLHEEWLGPDLHGLAEKLAGREVKGECTLVIAGAAMNTGETVVNDDAVEEAIEQALRRGERAKTIAADLAARYGLKSRDVYAQVVALAEKLDV